MKTRIAASILAIFLGSSAALAANTISSGDIKASGNSVTAGSVSIENAGYLVVHASPDGMKAGKVIGHAPLKAGENSNVTVSLDKAAKPGSKLIVMLHAEGDGNAIFDTKDKPVMANGAPVMQAVTVQ